MYESNKGPGKTADSQVFLNLGCSQMRQVPKSEYDQDLPQTHTADQPMILFHVLPHVSSLLIYWCSLKTITKNFNAQAVHSL